MRRGRGRPEMRRRTGAGEQKRSRDDDRDPERRLDCRQYGLRAPAKGNTGAVDNAEQQDRRHRHRLSHSELPAEVTAEEMECALRPHGRHWSLGREKRRETHA